MDHNEKSSKVHKRAPHSKPPFTLGELKKAVPPHCFHRSIVRSFSYLFLDFAIIFFFYYVANNCIGAALLPPSLSYVAWPVYAILQGCALARAWVLGHECGHHAFSPYEWLDDTVGFILHTPLLVPYFSFKYSHHRHHANTSSLEREEVHVPKLKSQLPSYVKYLNNPPARFFLLIVLLAFGLPLYLAFNFHGRSYDRFTNHLDPYSPIFTDRQRPQILISGAGILAVLYGLYFLAMRKGLTWVALVYGGPYLVMGGIVIGMTLLNHNDLSIPFYNSSEWDWLRGCLATVDRDFGILNHVVHKGTNTHVAHHLFTTMPFYHAEEATRAFKPILGDYYQFDDTPAFIAIWRVLKECVYVEPDDQNKGVYWYKNKV